MACKYHVLKAEKELKLNQLQKKFRAGWFRGTVFCNQKMNGLWIEISTTTYTGTLELHCIHLYITGDPHSDWLALSSALLFVLNRTFFICWINKILVLTKLLYVGRLNCAISKWFP